MDPNAMGSNFSRRYAEIMIQMLMDSKPDLFVNGDLYEQRENVG